MWEIQTKNILKNDVFGAVALLLIASFAFNPKNEQAPGNYTCFNEELFKRWNMIEQANARLGSIKTLLIRFETKAHR